MSKQTTIISFNPFFRFFARVVFLFTCGIIFIVTFFIYRMKIKGRKNLRLVKGAAITISNHCTYLDPGIMGLALYQKNMHFSGTEKAFKVKGLNTFVRLLGGFPIPAQNPSAITPFVRKALKRGDWVHFFAEGDLFDYNQKVFPLMDGAFFYSFLENVPVVPVSIVLKRHFFLNKEITRPFPRITIEIGTPFYPETFKNKGLRTKEAIKEMSSLCRESLQGIIDQNSGDKTLYQGQIQHRI